MTKSQHIMEMLYNLEEKWDMKNVVNPTEKGKYKDADVEELRSELEKLKASGPHKKESEEFGKMRELQFAIRAKTGWGNV